LLAHRIQHEGDAARLGLEQMAQRRLLLAMLGRGEARALGEVEDRRRLAAELRAGASGGFQVLAAFFRVSEAN